MIDNFTMGAVYGACISLSFGLIGNFVFSVFQLVRGTKDDE